MVIGSEIIIIKVACMVRELCLAECGVLRNV